MERFTNTRSKKASVKPANTTEVQLYAVPANNQLDGVLRICNQTATTYTYRVAHTTAGHGDVAADSDDWLAYDTEIPANFTHEISIHAGATETIRVRSGNADSISFHLSGNSKVVAV